MKAQNVVFKFGPLSLVTLAVLASCTGLQKRSGPVNSARKSSIAMTNWDHKYIADAKAMSFVQTAETLRISATAEITKFELHPKVKKLNSGSRVELTDRTKYHNGETAELEIALRIPKQDLKGLPESTTLFQWHESLVEGSKRPPVSMKLRGHQLLIFAWNDESFARGDMDSDGDIVATIPWEPDHWYRIQLKTQFSPVLGRLSISMREASELKGLEAASSKVLFDQPVNLGYREALCYYFKFGPYTTYPFQKTLAVEYFVPELPRLIQSKI